MDDKEKMCQTTLSALVEMKLKALKPTVTKVTSFNGTIKFYDHDSELHPPEGIAESFGFVVDTKPDLTIGQVKPWLLVTSQDVPADANLLNTLNVTHVLSLLPGFVLPPTTNSIRHLCLDLLDEETFNLNENILLAAFNFITKGKEGNGRVLVHCNAGISRAPSIVIAYLMLEEKLQFDEAWEIVKRVRPAAKPNSGFLRQLKSFAK